MNTYNIDYNRLSYLGDKVKLGNSTIEEKNEFMLMLYQNGNITQKQYSDYKNNQNAEEIVKAGLAIGAVVLIGYLIKQLFSIK